MNFITCPACGGAVLNITENSDYKCVSCGFEFNTHNPYHKSVTLEYTVNKSLFFPKLSEHNNSSSRCLFETVPVKSLDCSNIDCDDCIFGKENYLMYTSIKEKKGE